MKNKDITPTPIVSIPPVKNSTTTANTMWPIAQARDSTEINQQAYINTTLKLSEKGIEQGPVNIKNI